MKNSLLIGTALAGLTLGAGCQNERKQAVTREQEIAEARRDLAKTEADARREAVAKKTEIDEKVQKEIADEKRDVAKAQREQGEGVGGSGATATAATVTGILKSSLGNGLTVTERAGAELKLATDKNTQVTLNGSAVELDDFREGTPLRVSYETQGDTKVARDVMVLAPMRKN